MCDTWFRPGHSRSSLSARFICQNINIGQAKILKFTDGKCQISLQWLISSDMKSFSRSVWVMQIGKYIVFHYEIRKLFNFKTQFQ